MMFTQTHPPTQGFMATPRSSPTHPCRAPRRIVPDEGGPSPLPPRPDRLEACADTRREEVRREDDSTW